MVGESFSAFSAAAAVNVVTRSSLMSPEPLEFEEPVAALQKEIDALSALPRTDALDRQIETLRRRIETVRADLYSSLTPWQRVQVLAINACPRAASPPYCRR